MSSAALRLIRAAGREHGRQVAVFVMRHCIAERPPKEWDVHLKAFWEVHTCIEMPKKVAALKELGATDDETQAFCDASFRALTNTIDKTAAMLAEVNVKAKAGGGQKLCEGGQGPAGGSRVGHPDDFPSAG
ncbi:MULTISPECIES: hypothetical protein [Hyphomicrobiales]|uniref:hypothetical protein n=1 Tax=Hyphomicrobiales TaxID=356 RepID=UPI001BCE0AE1|nr:MULTISPECIES: hypothetical protein [Hyphomicrobiales]CAH1662801.1 hypothetical protein CHELA41_22271 [Hyphomicrobiales bacterium]MBS7741482.1 hypothetical protein [Chelatococcus sp. HY11]MBX3491207.1 hypothetical protein [Parvibaculum sp.]MBX3544499.1 hypothetical protein [Chelatococcus sp.]MCO5078978.1 hypothetical protein [Chelatococcus sp.]